jgi:glycosyltransferase involved in cell wall biosynthesis
VADRPMKLSVVIPAHNEVESIGATVQSTVDELTRAGIDYEILVIDDASGDGTAEIVHAMTTCNERIRCERFTLPAGLRSRGTSRRRPLHRRRGRRDDGRPFRFAEGSRPLLPRARAGI